MPSLSESLQYLQVPVTIVWITLPHLRNDEHKWEIFHGTCTARGQQLLQICSKQQHICPPSYHPLLSLVEFLPLPVATCLDKHGIHECKNPRQLRLCRVPLLSVIWWSIVEQAAPDYIDMYRNSRMWNILWFANIFFCGLFPVLVHQVT